MSATPASMEEVTRPIRRTRTRPGRVPVRERLVFASLLALGGVLMWIAGQFAANAAHLADRRHEYGVQS